MAATLAASAALLACSALASAAADGNGAAAKDAFRFEPDFAFGVDARMTAMYTGLLPMDAVPEATEGGHAFFWLQEARESPETAPLVVWTNGGPGCSSALALFDELGSFRLAEDGEGRIGVEMNDYAWNREANVLFVEHPVGTGFAFSDGALIHSERQMATDFYGFLQSFVAIFPEYAARDLYLTGESYAGMYLPFIAGAILDRNAALPADSALRRLQLRGILLGNGWVEPFSQSRSYAELLHGSGLIDDLARDMLRHLSDKCLRRAAKMLRRGEAVDRGTFEDCDLLNIGLRAAGMPNQYDTRLYDVPRDAYEDVLREDSTISKFMNDAENKEALHVAPTVLRSAKDLELLVRSAAGGAPASPGGLWAAHSAEKWSICSDAVNEALHRDVPPESLSELVRVIDYEPPHAAPEVVLYSGNRDLNCNTLGTQAFLEAMEWRGAGQWRAARREMWVLGDARSGAFEVAGYAKEVLNLHFVVMVNAGHLAPKDQPAASLDLLRRALRGEGYGDVAIAYPDAVADMGDFEAARARPAYDYSGPSSGKMFSFATLCGFAVGCFATVLVMVLRQVWPGDYDRIL